MNLLKLVFALFLLIPTVATSKPQVYLDYKTYYTPDNTPYVETLLQFVSPSLKFLANANGNLVSSLEITQIFKIGDSVVFVDKYIVNSPEMKDSTIEDYFDVKRYQLDENLYTFEIIITDLNNQETVSGAQTVKIAKLTNSKINFSSTELIQSISKTTESGSFIKNGYFMLPYLTNYYPPELTKIATYFEVYNSNKILGEGEKFMITTEIEDYKSGLTVDDFFKVKKYVTGKIVPIVSFLPIDQLPSGDYNLVVKLIDKNNITFKTEKIYFQRRSNIQKPNQISLESIDIDKSFTNTIVRDSIPYYLNSLMPIVARYDSKSILALLKSEDTLKMQQYFHSFWVQTNSADPFKSWLAYKVQVQKCEKLYGSWIKHGFESDRGRVFLQYGAPNQIADETNSSSSLPYQIWHYYRIGQRSNMRFVFYNQNISTNDFTLLHSNMLGELQNENWQEILHNRRGYNENNPSSTIEDRDNKDKQYGGQSGRYFNN
jgi:GWxTD domain-containing protein